MTVLSGEQLIGVAGAGIKSVTLAMPALSESRFTAVALPTSEPASGQWEYTVASGDLAVAPPGFVYRLHVCTAAFSGQNLSGASQTVWVRAYINGSFVTTASVPVSNNNYWTLQVYLAVVAGDALSLRLYGGSASVNYDTLVYQFAASRLAALGPDWIAFAPLTLGAAVGQGDCSLAGANNTGATFYYEINNGEDTYRGSNSSARNYSVFVAGPVNGLYRLYNGDQTTSTATANSATSHPSWTRVYVPGSLSYRRLNLRLPV